MKQSIILLVFVLATFTSAFAQNITVNNLSAGDVEIRAYAYAPATCTTTFVDFALGTVSGGTSTLINLNLPASWNSASVPMGAYDIVYVEVSRISSCPGTLGWGALSGTCATGNVYLDQITLGDTGCGFNQDGCIAVTLSGGTNCFGFNHGDALSVGFVPGGSSPTININ